MLKERLPKEVRLNGICSSGADDDRRSVLFFSRPRSDLCSGSRMSGWGWFLFNCDRVYDWVKKCMEYEVEGPRPKRTWTEVVREDCQARKLNKEDAVDCSKWRKLIKDVR